MGRRLSGQCHILFDSDAIPSSPWGGQSWPQPPFQAAETRATPAATARVRSRHAESVRHVRLQNVQTSGNRLRAELPAPRCRKYVALGFQAARSVKCGTPNRMPCHHVSLLLSPRLDHSRPAYRGRKPFTAVACEVAKMNFYLSAVNDLLRHPDDQLSIGPILFNWVSSGARQF